MLLNAAAVGKMRAASTSLAKHRNRITDSLSRFLKDCKEEKVPAAEHQRRITEQNTKTESGCKWPKSEDLDDCKAGKAEPEAKRIKREPD